MFKIIHPQISPTIWDITTSRHPRQDNLGAALIKQVASKTNDVAGDGTTTSTVLARAIFRAQEQWRDGGDGLPGNVGNYNRKLIYYISIYIYYNILQYITIYYSNMAIAAI